MELEALTRLVIDALEDIKAINIQVIDVRGKTTITDKMIIASGNSNRQVKALADSVINACKKEGLSILGTEGLEACEWALIDLGDIIVHVMQPAVRDFYNIEKLWGEQSPDEDNMTHQEANRE